jgi:hypothetical protein
MQAFENKFAYKNILIVITVMDANASGCVSCIVPLSFARGIIQLTDITSLRLQYLSFIKLEFHNKQF